MSGTKLVRRIASRAPDRLDVVLVLVEVVGARKTIAELIRAIEIAPTL